VVFALVDSLILHSGDSSVRLESYLFTQEAFEDVRHALKPDGIFTVYNFMRQGCGWSSASARS
jgi:spermidine synthase